MSGIELIIGAVLPVVVEFIVKYVEDSRLKFIISLVMSLFVGAVINWGKFSLSNVDEILASGAIIFASAQSVYKLYFKDSGLRQKISG